MIPGAGFEAGKPYDLTITLKPGAGGTTPDFARSVRAMAMDDRSLLLQMSSSAAFVKALTASGELDVQAGGKSLSFPAAADARRFG